ncbi:hypothetical protein CVAR292_02216 [Corynebacterium variabile]|uniref:Secreted protein n=1 Tax=Corynebacterium variabile TaxID=1727 RepID=A0A0X2NPS5_9CORY|nr:hypothetical protein CVAR292_02216 [Corynebacterium variabile]
MSTTTIVSPAAAVVGALLPGVSVASCSDSGGGGDPVDDRCSLEALSQAYGDGPGDIVGVAHCDGDWAVSQGSDDSLNRVFMHRDHGWIGFAADSMNPSTGTACYSTDRLQQVGVPAGVRALLPWCDRGQPPEPCSIDALHRTGGAPGTSTPSSGATDCGCAPGRGRRTTSATSTSAATCGGTSPQTAPRRPPATPATHRDGSTVKMFPLDCAPTSWSARTPGEQAQ